MLETITSIGIALLFSVSVVAIGRMLSMAEYRKGIFHAVLQEAENDTRVLTPTQAALLFQWRLEMYNEQNRSIYMYTLAPLGDMWTDYSFTLPCDKLCWQEIVEKKYEFIMLYLRHFNGRDDKDESKEVNDRIQ